MTISDHPGRPNAFAVCTAEDRTLRCAMQELRVRADNALGTPSPFPSQQGAFKQGVVLTKPQ